MRMILCQLFGALLLTERVCCRNIQIENLVEERGPDHHRDAEETTIHCYCNLPVCVSTGYMCKSHSLGCFSDLVSSLDMDRALHGCLDLIASERGDECQNVPGPETSSADDSSKQDVHQASLLLCCRQDMCNHVDSPEARNNYNQTLFAGAMVKGGGGVDEVEVGGGWRRGGGGYSERELWLRAATIAVPICGALILLILVLLAMKLLRSDVLDHRPIIHTKLRGKEGGVGGAVAVQLLNPDLSEKKHPLLYHYNPVIKTDNTDNLPVHPQVILVTGAADKNTKNARLNSSLDLFSTELFSKSVDLCSNNIYRTTQPLLPPNTEKLVSKKPFVSWPPPHDSR